MQQIKTKAWKFCENNVSEVLAFGNVYMIFVSGHGKNQQNVLVKKWENIKNEKMVDYKKHWCYNWHDK